MLIPCPVCGLRDHSEFTYGGDAGPARPARDDDSAPDWAAYVYDRDNPRGAHAEFWHHAHGCRHWLVVERDTVTHDVGATQLAGLRTPKQRAAKQRAPEQRTKRRSRRTGSAGE